MENRKQYFSIWRVFSLICSFAALITLIFLPECSCYLLGVCSNIEAMFSNQSECKNSYTHNPAAQHQLTKLKLPTELQIYRGFPPPPSRSVLEDFESNLEAFFSSMFNGVSYPVLKFTLLLLLLIFIPCFILWIQSLRQTQRIKLLGNCLKGFTPTGGLTGFTPPGGLTGFTLPRIVIQGSSVPFPQTCPAQKDFNTSAEKTESTRHVIYRNSTFHQCTISANELNRTTSFETCVFVNTNLFS